MSESKISKVFFSLLIELTVHEIKCLETNEKKKGGHISRVTAVEKCRNGGKFRVGMAKATKTLIVR